MLRPLLAFGEEQTQIAQVVPGGASHDCVLKPGEKRVSVALAEGGGRVEAERRCARQSFSIRDRAGSGTIPVDAVGANTENRDFLASDFFDARQSEGRVSASDSASSYRRAELTVGNQRNALAGIRTLPLFKLRK
jgi:hypothetical protein